jgi:hypothetical protein
VQSDYDEYTSFLTEKVLKPIYGGHPFLLWCAPPHALTALRAFGFSTFGATFNESYDEPRPPPLALNASGRSSTRASRLPSYDNRQHCVTDTRFLVAELARITHIPLHEWADVEVTAGRNQRHLICPGGLHARLIRHERAVLRLAKQLAARTLPASVTSQARAGLASS